MTVTERPSTGNQYAPYPDVLADLVEVCGYRPRWRVELLHWDRDLTENHQPLSYGLTLIITTRGFDSYNPDQGENYGVRHFFAVPPATYDRRSWQRWLFEQFLLVERHEAMEFFTVDGVRPYAPSHGPGNDPYMIREVGDERDQRTRADGSLASNDA